MKLLGGGLSGEGGLVDELVQEARVVESLHGYDVRMYDLSDVLLMIVGQWE